MKRLFLASLFFIITSDAYAGVTIWVAGEDDLMSWWAQLAQYFGY